MHIKVRYTSYILDKNAYGSHTVIYSRNLVKSGKNAPGLTFPIEVEDEQQLILCDFGNLYSYTGNINATHLSQQIGRLMEAPTKPVF